MSKQNNVMPMTLQNLDFDNIQEDKVASVSHEVEMHHAEEHSIVSFQNINYTVKMKKAPFGLCRPKKSKKILRDVRY